jgi:hypothetical protein
MRSAGVASFTPVTVAVFSTRVSRVFIAFLRRTFWVGVLNERARPGLNDYALISDSKG